MKLKRAILAVCAFASLGVSLVSGRTVSAVSCPSGSLRPSANTYAECNIDSTATADDLLNTIKNVVNVVLGVLGVVAVVVIIMGGFTFMTSQGDAGKVMKGRNTILWGVVGLVVSLAAFLIVNFVLDNIVGGGNNTNNNNYPGNNIQVDPNNNQNNNNYPGNNIQTNPNNNNNNNYPGNNIQTNPDNSNNNTYPGNNIYL